MALTGTTILEVRSDGNDANGGGFDTAELPLGVDRSQQAGPQANLSSGLSTIDALDNTKIVVSALEYTTMTSDVGNIVQMLTGGTSGFYKITDSTEGVWTLDRACGSTGAAITARMGGALATPGMAGKFLDDHGVQYMQVYVKYGTYELSSSSANVSGGTFDSSVMAISNLDLIIEGYETTRGDLGAKPVFSAGGYTPANTALWKVYGSDGEPHTLINLAADGNEKITSGFSGASTSNSRALFCLSENCKKTAIGGGFVIIWTLGCESRYNYNGYYQGHGSYCYSHHNDYYGYYQFFAPSHCISAHNGYRGFYYPRYGIFNCISYNDNDICFLVNILDTTVVDCIAWGGTYGAYGQSSSVIINFAAGNNSSARLYSITRDYNPITLTANPFIDGDNGDFRLNNDVGGGALCRRAGLGIPNQIWTPDVGAISLQEIQMIGLRGI